MLTYIILILLILILLLISYKLFDEDYLNPAVISCLSYLLGSFLAMYGLSSWNMNLNLMPKLIIIVVVGLLSFIFGYFISEKSIQKKQNKYSRYMFEKTDPEILPDTIRNGESIDVYYVEGNTKTVGYDVQYYADGVLRDTDKQRIVVNKDDPNPIISVNKSLINLCLT